MRPFCFGAIVVEGTSRTGSGEREWGSFSGSHVPNVPVSQTDVLISARVPKGIVGLRCEVSWRGTLPNLGGGMQCLCEMPEEKSG